jgi:hypothetical protein
MLARVQNSVVSSHSLTCKLYLISVFSTYYCKLTEAKFARQQRTDLVKLLSFFGIELVEFGHCSNPLFRWRQHPFPPLELPPDLKQALVIKVPPQQDQFAKRSVGNHVPSGAFLPLRWHWGVRVTNACQSTNATELGHILSASARPVGWCALVQPSWVLAWRRGVAHRKQVAPAYVSVTITSSRDGVLRE